MEKINIAEILKDCPKGMELDCTIWDNVVLDHIDMTRDCPIYFRIQGDGYEQLTKYGQWKHSNNAKCVIFPKGKTTWEGFVPPCEFKDGDIVVSSLGHIHILKNRSTSYIYVDFAHNANGSLCKSLTTCVRVVRLATEEEMQKLFDAIKANGYKWNHETKTLEKLIEPKFNVGDVVRLKSKPSYIYTIYCLAWDDNKKLAYKLLPKNDKHLILVSLNTQDDYELVPNKFDISNLKPFDKVLVRLTKYNVWNATFFSHYDKEVNYGCYPFVTTSSKTYSMCIPYEQNKHLLGTTDDCDEFYKNW